MNIVHSRVDTFLALRISSVMQRKQVREPGVASLRRYGYIFVGQAFRATEEELMLVAGIGPMSISRIKHEVYDQVGSIPSDLPITPSEKAAAGRLCQSDLRNVYVCSIGRFVIPLLWEMLELERVADYKTLGDFSTASEEQLRNDVRYETQFEFVERLTKLHQVLLHFGLSLSFPFALSDHHRTY
jgi:hypothetical protein